MSLKDPEVSTPPLSNIALVIFDNALMLYIPGLFAAPNINTSMVLNDPKVRLTCVPINCEAMVVLIRFCISPKLSPATERGPISGKNILPSRLTFNS